MCIYCGNNISQQCVLHLMMPHRFKWHDHTGVRSLSMVISCRGNVIYRLVVWKFCGPIEGLSLH